MEPGRKLQLLWLFVVIIYAETQGDVFRYAVMVPERDVSPPPVSNSLQVFISGTEATTVNITEADGNVMHCYLSEPQPWTCNITYTNITGDTDLYNKGIRIQSNQSVTVQSVHVADIVSSYLAIPVRDEDMEYVVLRPQIGKPFCNFTLWLVSQGQGVSVSICPVFSEVTYCTNRTLNDNGFQTFPITSDMPYVVTSNGSLAAYLGQNINCTDVDIAVMYQLTATSTKGLEFMVGPFHGPDTPADISITVIFLEEDTQVMINSSGQTNFTAKNYTGSMTCWCEPGAAMKECSLICNNATSKGQYVLLIGLSITDVYYISTNHGVLLSVTHGSVGEVPGFVSPITPLEPATNQVRVQVQAVNTESISLRSYLTVVVDEGKRQGILVNGLSMNDLKRLNLVTSIHLGVYDVITVQVFPGSYLISHGNPYVLLTAYINSYQHSTDHISFSYGLPAGISRNDEYGATTMETETDIFESPNPEETVEAWLLYVIGAVLGGLLAAAIIVIILVFTKPDCFKMTKKKKTRRRKSRMLRRPEEMNSTAPENDDPVTERYVNPGQINPTFTPDAEPRTQDSVAELADESHLQTYENVNRSTAATRQNDHSNLYVPMRGNTNDVDGHREEIYENA